jgi:Ca-activated chloride channel family protein
MGRMRLVILIAALSILGDSARPHAQQISTFRSGVDVVYLDVTVIDRDGAIVRGLTANDFKVFDEGVEHEVAIFSDAPQPISVGVLIDASGSMAGDRMQAAVAAAAAVGHSMRPTDLWSVATFSARLDRLSGWRPYDDATMAKIQHLSAGGGTALFKSVADFAKGMADTPHRKRAMLVITDGADDSVGLERRQRLSTSNEFDPTRPSMPIVIDHSALAISTLRSGEVQVYAMGLDWPQAVETPGDLHEPSLRKLADPTGGVVTIVRSRSQAETAAGRLADELRLQYTLGFYPQKTDDGKYRRIKVVAKNSSYEVRTRGGYLATRPR